MTKSITLKDVARKAGTSLGTASRVINEAPGVDAGIRARVSAAVKALNYVPNAHAQSMRRQGTGMIGVIVRDISVSALAGFVRAVQDDLSASGYALLIANSDDDPDTELRLLRLLATRRVDGLIMTTASDRDERLRDARRDMQCPVVLLDRVSDQDGDSVVIDHAEGMRLAVSHLLALGHRRIALLTGPATAFPAHDRIVGFRDAMQASGCFDPDLVRPSGFTEENGYLETMSLLGRRGPPSAVIAGGVALLPGVLRAVQSAAVQIPNDLSVIGGPDSTLARLLPPGLSMLDWSYSEMGRMASRLLLRRINSSIAVEPSRLVLKPHLIIRGSTVRRLDD